MVLFCFFQKIVFTSSSECFRRGKILGVKTFEQCLIGFRASCTYSYIHMYIHTLARIDLRFSCTHIGFKQKSCIHFPAPTPGKPKKTGPLPWMWSKKTKTHRTMHWNTNARALNIAHECIVCTIETKMFSQARLHEHCESALLTPLALQGTPRQSRKKRIT